MARNFKTFHEDSSINSVLLGYYEDFDSNCTKINDTEDLCAGHVIVFYLGTSYGKKASSKNFYSLVQNAVKTSKNNYRELINFDEFASSSFSLLNKYDYMIKCNKPVLELMELLRKPLDIFETQNESYDTTANTSNKSADYYLELLQDSTAESNSETDIYERYFDLSSQDLEPNEKNVALAKLMEDAMSKLHDSEIQIHKLRSAVKELMDQLTEKSEVVDKVQSKLKNGSEKSNIAANLTKQIARKEDDIVKLKSENSQLTEVLAKRNEYIKELEKQATLNEFGTPEYRKPNKRRRDIAQDFEEPNSPVKKEKLDESEKKIVKLVKERSNPEISETLLELFPDISISDFEVILKILTDSDVLLGHRIMHKWNVNGKDINFYGTIKENLKNQNKFYITYGKHRKEKLDTDFEVVDYSVLISDIISKDLSFLDPGSLF